MPRLIVVRPLAVSVVSVESTVRVLLPEFRVRPPVVVCSIAAEPLPSVRVVAEIPRDGAAVRVASELAVRVLAFVVSVPLNGLMFSVPALFVIVAWVAAVSLSMPFAAPKPRLIVLSTSLSIVSVFWREMSVVTLVLLMFMPVAPELAPEIAKPTPVYAPEILMPFVRVLLPEAVILRALVTAVLPVAVVSAWSSTNRASVVESVNELTSALEILTAFWVWATAPWLAKLTFRPLVVPAVVTRASVTLRLLTLMVEALFGVEVAVTLMAVPFVCLFALM